MMDDRNDADKMDDVMLPGFRFHPTDEELVGFYLKRKIQQRSMPIELIKQVDIYKYDPWDLPKLAGTGEKEWYFYCPRDRKYRNSARPNRVTGAGFWKATGTDRPIYSSDGSRCIGLKKSLVFYRGRAAKGIKTDWMMHEFRLPSVADSAPPPKKFLDKSLPANDSWAICRIFKKTNSMAQRGLSHSWVSPPLPPTAMTADLQFSSENISCTTENGSSPSIHLCCNNDSGSFSAMDIPSYKTINPAVCKSSLFSIPNPGDLHNSSMFLPLEIPEPSPGFLDLPLSSDGIVFGGPQQQQQQQQINGFSISLPEDLQGNFQTGEEGRQSNNIRSFGFPFSLPNLPWESPPCPSEMSTSYSTNKGYS